MRTTRDPGRPSPVADRPCTGPRLVWPGKQQPPLRFPAALTHTDAHDGPAREAPRAGLRNRLLHGDNLPLMAALLPELRGRIDLAYLDPPFNAGHPWSMEVSPGSNGRTKGISVPAYDDTWDEAGYLQMLYERLILVRELLAETGSLIVHVNWRVAHLAQALLDEVFGPGERQGPGRPGFRNEIIWGYGGGGAVKNAYRRKHDNLYWYTRSDRWTFNPQYRPYTDGTRQRGLTAVKGDRYELREEGAQLQSWWTGPEVQKILSPTAYENLKYPTQKPEALLRRIITGHSNPGDLVADFFCGSGTTGAVAERLGRRWIMADLSPLAVHVTRKRLMLLQAELAASGAEYRPFDLYRTTSPPDHLTTPPPHHPTIIPVLHADGTVDVRLDGEEADLDLVDAWSVDWDWQQGAPFRHRWSACRSRRERALPLRSEARLRYEPGAPRAARVKIMDVCGGEAVVPVTFCRKEIARPDS